MKDCGMNRYRVKIGRDFEIDAAEIVDASALATLVGEVNRFRSATHRDWLGGGLLVAIALALSVAAIISAFSGSYEALHSTWDILSVPLTAILTFYFTGNE
jgi:hypothetical protein